MFLLGLTIFLQHVFYFRSNSLLRRAGERLFVVEPRVHQSLVARAQGRERSNQIAVVQAAIAVSGLGECVSQSHEQMLALIQILVRDLNLQKQGRGIYLVRRTRLFVLTCLLQVRAIARTIQGHFSLLATTLRADSAMDGRTKALLLADLANGATQWWLLLSIMTPRQNVNGDRRTGRRARFFRARGTGAAKIRSGPRRWLPPGTPQIAIFDSIISWQARKKGLRLMLYCFNPHKTWVFSTGRWYKIALSE